MSLRYFWLATASLMVLASSCGGDDPVDANPSNYGTEYLPLEVGSWIEYAVDSTVFDDFNETVITYELEHREEVVETYEDLEGRTAYRIERSKRIPGETAFSVFSAFELVKTDTRVERKADGFRLVPLVFPVREDGVWNGNAFNAKGQQEFTYLQVDAARTENGFEFDKTLQIIQQNDTNNFVVKRYVEERYASGLGLVYDEFLEVETQFGIDSGLHMIRVVSDWSGR